jgi:hypothetical protein
LENPAAAADERARVALQTDRRHVRLDAAAVLHRRNCMRISAKASVSDARERETGLLAAMHLGFFHAQAATGPWQWQYILSIVPGESDETHICKNA